MSVDIVESIPESQPDQPHLRLVPAISGISTPNWPPIEPNPRVITMHEKLGMNSKRALAGLLGGVALVAGSTAFLAQHESTPEVMLTSFADSPVDWLDERIDEQKVAANIGVLAGITSIIIAASGLAYLDVIKKRS